MKGSMKLAATVPVSGKKMACPNNENYELCIYEKACVLLPKSSWTSTGLPCIICDRSSVNCTQEQNSLKNNYLNTNFKDFFCIFVQLLTYVYMGYIRRGTCSAQCWIFFSYICIL